MSSENLYRYETRDYEESDAHFCALQAQNNSYKIISYRNPVRMSISQRHFTSRISINNKLLKATALPECPFAESQHSAVNSMQHLRYCDRLCKFNNVSMNSHLVL